MSISVYSWATTAFLFNRLAFAIAFLAAAYVWAARRILEQIQVMRAWNYVELMNRGVTWWIQPGIERSVPWNMIVGTGLDDESGDVVLYLNVGGPLKIPHRLVRQSFTSESLIEEINARLDDDRKLSLTGR